MQAGRAGARTSNPALIPTMENPMTETKQTDTTNHVRGAPVSPSPELIGFRELVSQEAAAWAVANAADEAHDKEGEAKAMAVIGPLGHRIGELADLICARAVRSWADAIECAEVAHWWQDKRPDGSLWGLTSKNAGDRVNARLISAVLALGGGGVH
jgi:hypothetical protein